MILRCILFVTGLALATTHCYAAVSKDLRNDDIEIVEGGDRTVYEYRTNGILMMIKVVPRHGHPYYMAPADGTPHYESLEHVKKLYPHWVIIEF